MDCPNKDHCKHSAKLVLTKDGCCADCGRQVKRRCVHHLTARRIRLLTTMAYDRGYG